MNFRYETQKLKQGYTHVIGCDEVGRGCLAGPVVAAAVILNVGCKMEDVRHVRDSKLLSSSMREELDGVIKQNSVAWGIGLAEEKLIDEINIHNATLLAMRRAVESLTAASGITIPRSASDEESLTLERGILRSAQDGCRALVVIDGKFTVPDFGIQQEAVVDGDAKILSVAAASIIAKVYRDNLMRQLHQEFPIYNFAQHKGYATLFHRTMILQNGLSPRHRKSFCKNLAQI